MNDLEYLHKVNKIFNDVYRNPQPEGGKVSQERWPFEGADSLQHHMADLVDRLGSEIEDEDPEAALNTLDRIYAKVRELKREFMEMRIPEDVRKEAQPK